MAITNPRFVNYARAHGRTPEAQLEFDRTAYPGGVMAGFVSWNTLRLAEARREIAPAFMVGGQLVDHGRYDAWLNAWVDRRLGAAMEVLREVVRLWELGADNDMGHLLNRRAKLLVREG